MVKDPVSFIAMPAPLDADNHEDNPPKDAAAGLEVVEEDIVVPLLMARAALVEEDFLPPLFFDALIFSPARTLWASGQRCCRSGPGRIRLGIWVIFRK